METEIYMVIPVVMMMKYFPDIAEKLVHSLPQELTLHILFDKRMFAKIRIRNEGAMEVVIGKYEQMW